MIQDFNSFPKIPRLNREIIITEKIDGTNAQIAISPVEDGDEDKVKFGALRITGDDGQSCWVQAGSRNRWIQPENDNFGFARWVYENARDLIRVLGHGRHFGEWWGPGIQRGYGLKQKRLSLFNVSKWDWLKVEQARQDNNVPEQLHVVPTLYSGGFFGTCYVNGIPNNGYAPALALQQLEQHGSFACPGFMRPEGIVVFHSAAGVLFKATIEGDESRKSDSNGGA